MSKWGKQQQTKQGRWACWVCKGPGDTSTKLWNKKCGMSNWLENDMCRECCNPRPQWATKQLHEGPKGAVKSPKSQSSSTVPEKQLKKELADAPSSKPLKRRRGRIKLRTKMRNSRRQAQPKRHAEKQGQRLPRLQELQKRCKSICQLLPMCP